MNDISYRDLFDLSGKVAIVTGGAGILGRHFCEGLAEYGAKVAVVDLLEDKAVAIAKSIKDKFSVDTVAIGCDVTDAQSVQRMVKHVLTDFGEINILHNNAAGKSEDLDAFFAPFEEYRPEQWRSIMSVNLEGMFLVAQAVGKQMINQGKGGSVIQTASIYGVLSPDQRIYEGSHYLDRQINTPGVYAASKAGVLGLSKYLATYWANHGIRVNTLTPGGTESGQNDVFKERYSNRVPMNRMAKAHEMVGALLYLASEASSYVTGQNIIVDGGLSAW